MVFLLETLLIFIRSWSSLVARKLLLLVLPRVMELFWSIWNHSISFSFWGAIVMNVVWVLPIGVVVQRWNAFLNIGPVIYLITNRIGVMVILSLIALSIAIVIVSTLILIGCISAILISLIILIILFRPSVRILAFLQLIGVMSVWLTVIFLWVLHVGRWLCICWIMWVVFVEFSLLKF